MLRVQPASLDWALQHAIRFGDTDLFPPAFEYRAIEHAWTTIRTYLATQNVLEWPTRTSRSCLVPKGRYSFRIATQLDPLDFLLYAAVVYEVANAIELRRVPIRRNVVFSWRVGTANDGRLFSPSVNYSSFQEYSAAQADLQRIRYVAVADISDFYHRIYHHRLENALSAAVPNTPYVGAVGRLLDGWLNNVSYGLPVGPAPSRLLAELTIADVDDALLADGFRYARFNDDFRFFVGTEQEGYRAIARLAQLLYDMHGLTLQPRKTDVLTVDAFKRRILPTEEDQAVDQLRERFRSLAQQLGLASEYDEIDLDALDEEQIDTVNSMNLAEMLRGEIGGDGEPDFGVVRFALSKLGQLGNSDVIDDLIGAMERLYPVFDSVIAYFKALPRLSGTQRRVVGSRVLALSRRGILSELQFHRMWALELFADSADWNNVQTLRSMGGISTDHFTRRNVILALGRSREVHWFSAARGQVMEEAPWARRAFLLAASCMPADATRHWYASLRTRLDPLEVAVTRWAAQHPFRVP